MVNVLTVLQDIAEGKNDFDVIDKSYIAKCNAAVQKGIDCIIKTQYKQNGILTRGVHSTMPKHWCPKWPVSLNWHL